MFESIFKQLTTLGSTALFALAIAASCATSSDDEPAARSGSGGSRAAGGALGRGGRVGSGGTAATRGSGGALGGGGSLGGDGSLDRDSSGDAPGENDRFSPGDGPLDGDASQDRGADVTAEAARDGSEAEASAIDSGPSSDRCPGPDLILSGSPPAATVSGDLSSLNADYPACGAPGRDAVYRLVTPQSGIVTFTLTPTGFDGALYLRVGQCETATPVCRNTAGAGGVETQPISAGTNAQIYVFVDSIAGEGPYTLSATY